MLVLCSCYKDQQLSLKHNLRFSKSSPNPGSQLHSYRMCHVRHPDSRFSMSTETVHLVHSISPYIYIKIKYCSVALGLYYQFMLQLPQLTYTTDTFSKVCYCMISTYYKNKSHPLFLHILLCMYPSQQEQLRYVPQLPQLVRNVI